MSAAETNPIDHPAFTEVDRCFAVLMERLAGGAQPGVALGAALASHRAGEVSQCADLRATDAGLLKQGDVAMELELPERESWLEELRTSRVVGAPGEFKPLILDERGRLYLHRCWEQEQQRLTADGSAGALMEPQ